MLSLLQEDLKNAMKSKDKATLMGLRNIICKLKAKKIDKGEELTQKECFQILQSSAKQLKDSIIQYSNGGRDDLAKIEKYELKLIKKYLPTPMTKDELRIIVQKTIKLNGATSIKDMGTIMGNIMKDLAGAVDGNMVQNIVKEELI